MNTEALCNCPDPAAPHRLCIRPAGHPGVHQDNQFWWGDINARGGGR